MSRHARFAVVWLLSLLVPFQVLIAAYLDVLGPAHFHVGRQHDGHRHDRLPERQRGTNPDHGHYIPHFHAQHQVERHHHHPHDPSVVTVLDHGLSESLALKDETAPGWSATMLVVLLAIGASLLLRTLSGGLTPQPETLPKTRFPGRLERPPRIIPL
jgi:hypothetical protein